MTQMRDQIQDFARRISHNADCVAQITNRIDASEQQITGGQSQTVQLRADVDHLKNWNGTLETNVHGMLSRLAALESRGGGGSGTRPKMALTEMRGAATIPEYRGDSDGWEEFSLRFRVFLGQNCPTTRDLLKWAETVDDPDMTEALVRKWGEVNSIATNDLDWSLEQLNRLLGGKCRGGALNQWKSCENHGKISGLLAWRLIRVTARGREKDRIDRLSAEVFNPKACASLKEVPDALSKWENHVEELATEGTHVLDDAMKRRYVIKLLPVADQKQARAFDTTYTAYSQLRKYVLNIAHDEMCTYEPPRPKTSTRSFASGSSGPTPMDTNRVGTNQQDDWNQQGNWDDWTWDQPQQENPETAEQLFNMMKGKGGGKKGGGKGFQGVCNHCGKQGHMKKDCAILDKEMAARRAQSGGKNSGFWKGGGKGKGWQQGGEWNQWNQNYGKGGRRNLGFCGNNDSEVPMDTGDDAGPEHALFRLDCEEPEESTEEHITDARGLIQWWETQQAAKVEKATLKSYYSRNSFAVLSELEVDESEASTEDNGTEDSAEEEVSELREVAVESSEDLLEKTLKMMDATIEALGGTSSPKIEEKADDPQGAIWCFLAIWFLQLAAGIVEVYQQVDAELEKGDYRDLLRWVLAPGRAEASARMAVLRARLGVQDPETEHLLAQYALEQEVPLQLLGSDPGGSAVNAMDLDDDEWEELVAIVDSGAAESVAPATVAPYVPVVESRGSRQGQQFFTADGARLPNQGEKKIVGVTKDNRAVSMVYQVADVTKALCSVGRVADRGNLVCFDDKGGVIYNKSTRNLTPFSREQGVYALHTWVRKPKNPDAGFARRG